MAWLLFQAKRKHGMIPRHSKKVSRITPRPSMRGHARIKLPAPSQKVDPGYYPTVQRVTLINTLNTVTRYPGNRSPRPFD